MKKLMTMVAATMAFAAFAEGSQPPPPEGQTPDVTIEKMAKRPSRPPMMMGQGAGDPLFRAVMNPKIADQLALTDEQKARLAALKPDRKANQALQAKVREGTVRQVKLLEAEQIDEAAVMQAIDEVFEARKAMAKAQTKRVIDVRSILTPEQASKALEAMKAQRNAPMMRGKGPKGEGPKGEGPKGKGLKGEGPKGPCPACEGSACDGPKCDQPPCDGPKGDLPPCEGGACAVPPEE